MAHWQFWLFLTVTLIRPIPQLYLEWRNHRNEKIISCGNISTGILYMSYFVIWWSSLYHIYHIDLHHDLTRFILGLIVLVIGMTMRFAGLKALNQFYSSNISISPSHHLVQNGIYRIIRHPLHAALLIELIGMIITSGQWWLTFILGVLFITIKFRNHQEDRLLLRIFGQEASDYQKTVPAMNMYAGIMRLFQKHT